MNQFVERRKFQRCPFTICKVLASRDRTKWDELEIMNISAGGIKFKSRVHYSTDTILHFNLYTYYNFSEFNMHFEGQIIRNESTDQENIYVVAFNNSNEHNQKLLDEIINYRMANVRSDKPVVEDGVYAFMLLPGLKIRRVKSRTSRK